MPKPKDLLDVGRQLSVHTEALTDDNATEVFAKVERGYGREANWKDVLKKRICLLIGRANTGKTCELTLLQQRLQAEHKFAFLLPLRALLEKKSLDELFPSRDDAEVVQRWSESDEEAVFLLDSIDEADLFREGAFTECLGVLRRLLGDSRLARARWVISTRPGTWSSSRVASMVRSELCPTEAHTTAELEPDDEASHATTSSPLQSDVVIAALRPLNRRQARKFLQRVFKVDRVADAESFAANLGLTFALESPGDLKWFAQLAVAEPAPRSRREAFEVAARRLATARTNEMTSSLDEVVAELERLSAASLFCGSGLFALREAESTGGSLPLSELLGHRDYSFEKLVKALPLVSDAGLQRIKFVPEHVQHFLAAQWLRKRCSTTSDQLALMDLFRRESLAGPLVPWQLLVCAGWLSCSLPDFRRCLLEVAPHAVLFLGDMAELTPAEGAQAIERTFERMAKGHPLLPSALNLTGDDYWHMARPELVPALVDCFRRYASHDICALHLLKVFGYRRTPAAVPALREYYAGDAHSARHKRLCLEALEECGGLPDLEWMARIELDAGAPREDLARALACALIRADGDERLVVQLCVSLKRDEIGLKYHFSDAAAATPDDKVLRYVSSLLAERGTPAWESLADEDDEDSRDESMTPSPTIALALLRGFLTHESMSAAAVDETIRLLEVIRQFPARHDGYDRFDDFPELTRAVPGFQRKALVVLANAIPIEEAFKLTRGDRYLYVEYDHTDRDLILEVQSNAPTQEAKDLLERLLEQTAPHVSAQAPQRVSPVGENRRRRVEANKTALTEDVEAIRTCTDVGKVSRAAVLAAEMRASSSRYGVAAWSRFTETYGEVVADAVKAGVRRLWRTHAPMFDANDTNSTYHQTIAGLVGLHLELAEENAYGALSPAEVARAFEYAPFEINQFPEWVSELARRFPTVFEDFVVKTVSSWQANPAAKQHATHTIERVARDESLPVSARVAQAVWTAVLAHACGGPYVLARALDLVARFPTELSPELEATASEKAMATWGNSDDLADFSLWCSAWAKVAPQAALEWLEAATVGFDEASKHKLVLLASHWQETGDGILAFEALEPRSRCAQLSKLYLLLLRAAPPEEDVLRLGIHARSDRDEAARLRDSLLGRIASVGGHAAYDALYWLALRDDVSEHEKRTLHMLALGVAEAAATPPAWTVQQFLDYARQSTAPLADPQSLWKAVRLDLDEVVRNLKDGDFSPRGMLLRASEKDMQLWLSRELELLAHGRYRVFRERELANGTTPDLTALSTAGHIATLELKLGDNRSEKSLLSDLRRQLHDDYMQDKDSNFGLFVVMWRETSDRAARDNLRKKVARVTAALEHEAASLCAGSNGCKYLEVRCFICPLDVSPRNQKGVPT